jgi:hypothetical protein
MNYCSGTIDIILNKNLYQCYHFLHFKSTRGLPGLTGEVPALTIASPGLCLDGPERILVGWLGITVVLPGLV